MYNILQKIFPGIKKDILEICNSYTLHSKYQKQRKQAIYRCFLKERKELRRKAEELIYENLHMKLIQMQQNKAFEGQMKKVNKLKAELEEKRKKYDRIQKEIEKKQRLKEEQAKRELMLQKKKFEEHALFVRQKAEAYKEEKRKEVMSVMKERDLRSREIELETKALIQLKASEVVKRQTQAEANVIKLNEETRSRKQEVEQRRERLKAAIEKYGFRPQVARSEGRMMAETESVALRKEAKESRPLFNNPGFYDDHLMNDIRFKVSTRLFEAGLQNTEYAKGIINGLSKPPQ